jgi:hypothetical protein
LTPDAAVRGRHFGLDRVCLCLSLLRDGRTSLRSVPRICQVIDADKGLLSQPLPDWTTSRMWLMQLGLAQLRRDVVKADDWFWLVDHSVQLGRDRLMVVLGSRLSEMPPVGQCLRRQDLQLLHLAVMRDPNMHKNHQELLKVMARTGRPRVLLSDHGADLKGAVRLLGEGLGPQAGMLDVHDIKHRTALALKHRLQDDARWKEFLSQTGKARNAAKQTEWAFLLPPVLRTKSRYLNLGELVPWACKTARLVQSPPPAVLEHGTVKRLKEKFGWLSDFQEDLKVWNGWYRVAARTEEVVRTRGLYRGVEKNLEVRLSGLIKDENSREMAGELKAFVKEQSARLKEGERAPGSTEVLESCFGTLKQLERDQSRSGFTGLVLGLGALVGNFTKEVVANALDSTPVKAVRNWCKENIGMSIQAKRRQAYCLVGVTNPK